MFRTAISNVRQAVAITGLGLLTALTLVGMPDAQAQVDTTQIDATSTETRTVSVGDTLTPIVSSYIGLNFTAELLPNSQLPIGLALGSDGYFLDSPSETGLFVIDILLTDSATQEQELRNLTLVVRSAEATVVMGEIGLVPEKLMTADGRTMLKAEIVAGQLPAGLGMAGDGVFSGGAIGFGTYEADILITDLVSDQQELRTLTFIIGENAVVDVVEDIADDETIADDAATEGDTGSEAEVLGLAQVPTEIAVTGSESGVLSLAGLAMIIAGTTTVRVGRRRQRQAFFDHIN